MSILVLVLMCLGMGLAIRLLRRWPRLVFIATLVGTALLTALLAAIPVDSFNFLGRALVLDDMARVYLIPALAVTAALAFFGPLNFDAPADSPAQILANSQGAFLFWSLAPLIVAMTLDSFPLAIFFWAIGLIVLMLLASPHREGRVGGAAQFLFVIVLATASLLLASRIIDVYPFTPENLDLIRDAVIFLSLGLGLLLAVAPFHIWLGPLADEMPPLGIAFLVGVAQPVGLWIVFERMSQLLWLTPSDKSPLLTVLLMGGALTAPVGALLAFAERRDGRFVAYLSMVSLGTVLMGFSIESPVGVMGGMLALLNRAIGIALIAGGLSFARHHFERRWQLVGAFAILCGGIAMAGIPPAPGFAARWVIYREFADTNAPLLALLLASNAAALLATVRIVWSIVAEVKSDGDDGEIKIVPYLAVLVVIALLVFLVMAGLAPQSIANSVSDVVGNARYLK